MGVAGGVFLLWRLATHTGLSGDVYWQWAAGRWMLNHHRLLVFDPFSYTVRGHAWFTEEWGYEVLLAGLIRLIGPLAFWVLSAGLGTLAVATVAVRVRMGAGWSWAGFSALILSICLLLFQRDRPQEISYWFFPLELLLLQLWYKKRSWGIAVVGLMALWANLHGSFLLGLFVLTLDLIWAARPWRWGRLVAESTVSLRDALVLWGASALATFLNPHGPSLWAYAAKVATNPAIARYILEWQSPNFHDLLLLVLVLLPVGVTVAALVARDDAVPVGPLMLAGILLAASLDSVRFLPYFMMAWCITLSTIRPFDLRSTRPSPVTWGAIVLIGIVLLSGPTYAPGTVSRGEPVAALSYLRHRPGRIFAMYGWGGYLIYRHIPVFIDGRTDMYLGTGILHDYIAVSTLAINPETIFHDYNVRYVLWEPGTPLATFLDASPSWRVVFETSSQEVFQHRGAW